ncbi:uncharacterized protein N7496_005771 [Penicillium cataractarum]|uniref:GPI anchored protein n=1 Tax=Penicillium cataractarum TaxID=2100454 RepID=A0A9W9S306_9EURO|nr:uncharacterized protein N7496_005771 [Penicillium cataractarum]KAJ5369679.1 hypothetical protein N7496_005771 [Penicillium cataractarum]
MGFKTLLNLATLGLVAAETSVVSLFIFHANPQSLVGSAVATNAGTTTYSINCGPDVESQECPLLPGLLYTAGPKTVEWSLKYPYDSYGRVVCSMGGTTTAVCTDVMPSTGSLSQPSETTTLAGDQIYLNPVTITAGPSASATDASTAMKTTSNSGSTGNTASAPQQSGSSASSSGDATKTSTGGLPQVTANSKVVLGGAAVALMAAAL